MLFQPHVVRQFVDALLADHGRIHVGDEQLLAARGGGLHHHVDRQILQRGAQSLGDRFVVRAARRKGKVDGDAGIENAHVLRGRQHADGERDRGIVERGVCGIADESGDVSHSETAGKAVLIAGPTASGKSALALALAEQDRRHDRQCGLDAGLSRPARHHGAADAGGGGAGAAPALWACRCGGELFGRALACGCRAGAGGGEGGRARADPRRRHRALLQGADARDFECAADPGGCAGGRACQNGDRRAERVACRTRAARSFICRTQAE